MMAKNLIMADEITAQYNEFKKFLRDIGLNDIVIENYTANLFKLDENFLQKHAGCKSVYQIVDRHVLQIVIDAMPRRFHFGAAFQRNPLSRYMQFLQVLEDRNIVKERSEAFRLFLERQLLHSRRDAEQYSNLLCSPSIIDTMIKSFGVSSVYCIDNPAVLGQVKALLCGTSRNSIFRNVVDIYAKWISSQMPTVNVNANAESTSEIIDLQNAIKEKDKEIADLKALLVEKDSLISCLKEQTEAKIEESEVHDEMCDLLTLDAVMQHCNENCTETSEVKAILDMLSELYQGVTDKRWTNAKKELRKRIKALKNPMNVQNLVLEQNIGHNVENVEPGAVGIKVSGGEKA